MASEPRGAFAINIVQTMNSDTDSEKSTQSQEVSEDKTPKMSQQVYMGPHIIREM